MVRFPGTMNRRRAALFIAVWDVVLVSSVVFLASPDLKAHDAFFVATFWLIVGPWLVLGGMAGRRSSSKGVDPQPNISYAFIAGGAAFALLGLLVLPSDPRDAAQVFFLTAAAFAMFAYMRHPTDFPRHTPSANRRSGPPRRRQPKPPRASR
jgi:hypothetical protein